MFELLNQSIQFQVITDPYIFYGHVLNDRLVHCNVQNDCSFCQAGLVQKFILLGIFDEGYQELKVIVIGQKLGNELAAAKDRFSQTTFSLKRDGVLETNKTVGSEEMDYYLRKLAFNDSIMHNFTSQPSATPYGIIGEVISSEKFVNDNQILEVERHSFLYPPRLIIAKGSDYEIYLECFSQGTLDGLIQQYIPNFTVTSSRIVRAKSTEIAWETIKKYKPNLIATYNYTKHKTFRLPKLRKTCLGCR